MSQTKKIDDLSYSGLVGIIQGDKRAAADTINSCALELEALLEQIKKVEAHLASLNSRKASLIYASELICKHMKLQRPLAVQRQGYIVVITEHNMSIERNVL